jgi:hypothetical protein
MTEYNKSRRGLYAVHRSEIARSLGSFSTEAASSATRPTFASPQKLTSSPNGNLVAMCHERTYSNAGEAISTSMP